MTYATALKSDPAATYRRIDVAGRSASADAPALVQLLYDELVSALRAAAHAVDRGQWAIRSERVTRAIAILFALEAGLDHERGGALAGTLATLYTGARQRVVAAAVGTDPAPFRSVADQLAEIAGAWSQARGG